MIGRAAVHSHRQRIEATFKRVGELDPNSELVADLSRYLCVLASGYVDHSASELLVEHARRNGGLTLQRFVARQTSRITNLKKGRLVELFGSFNTDWRLDLEGYIVDDREAALNSIVSLRNQIAHGRSTDISFHRMRTYFKGVVDVVDRLADLSCP